MLDWQMRAKPRPGHDEIILHPAVLFLSNSPINQQGLIQNEARSMKHEALGFKGVLGDLTPKF